MPSPTADVTARPPRPGFGARLWNAPYILLPLAILFWSGNFVVGRAVHAEVPPVALAFWRWTGALALVLCIAVPRLRRDLPVLRAQWRIVLILAASTRLPALARGFGEGLREFRDAPRSPEWSEPRARRPGRQPVTLAEVLASMGIAAVLYAGLIWWTR